MDIIFEESPQFKQLMSGRFLNVDTTRAFLAEVTRETLGPGGIGRQHFDRGQGRWKPLSPATLREKGQRDARIFFRTGRVYRAITTRAHEGSLLDWGSSADIYSTNPWKPKRYSANGVYASVRAGRTSASLTIGFNGRYKHSASFNRVRRQLAKENLIHGKAIGQLRRTLTQKQVRNLVSVGQVERKLRSLNADRRRRGIRPIRKTAAMGSQGIRGNRHVLARGKDNLAYADIVQRGKFLGIRNAKGVLFSPRGLTSMKRTGLTVKGTLQFGQARPLWPFEKSDETRLTKAMERAMSGMAKALNK